MNIFSKFEYLNDLTDSEKILVDYIKDNPDSFIKMSASDISKTCYVSTSSVYRLCNKLGCSGLSELKVQVSASLTDYIHRPKDFDYDYPIKPNQTQYQITNKLKEVYENTVLSSINLLDLEQLRLSVSQLRKSKTIDIYTSAGNIFFAENFKFQMQEIGVNVNVPIEEYQQKLVAVSSDSTHTAIIISFGGRTINTNDLIRILKKNRTPIITITTPNSPIEKKGDYVIYMNPYENHYNKISSFSTRLSLLYILDSIYACYFELDYEKNVKYKLEKYELMNTRGKNK